MNSPTDKILRCPNCGGRDVRRSMHAGFTDELMAIFQRSPFRCRGCQHRFYRRVVEQETEESGTPAADDKQKAAG